jgi:hypothetical protein
LTGAAPAPGVGRVVDRRLVAAVGQHDAYITKLPAAGTYTIVVHDDSKIHNFALGSPPRASGLHRHLERFDRFRHSSSVVSSPRFRAAATHSMCAWRRFDTSPSGATSACGLVACSMPSQNGHT